MKPYPSYYPTLRVVEYPKDRLDTGSPSRMHDWTEGKTGQRQFAM